MHLNLVFLLGKEFVAFSDEKLSEMAPDEREEYLTAYRAFEESEDYEMTDSYMRAAEKEFPFKMKEGRWDPWERHYLMQYAGEYHHMVGHEILTWKDALDRAMQLCMNWNAEDQKKQEIISHLQQLQKDTAAKKARNKVTPGTREYEVEQARLHWKGLVAKKNEFIAEMDREIELARVQFKTLRDG